jgi:hypothetical protein
MSLVVRCLFPAEQWAEGPFHLAAFHLVTDLPRLTG